MDSSVHLTKNRVFGFDLIRGTSILLIVIYHGLQLFTPFYPRIYTVAFPANISIEYFFVLSGILIGSLLLDVFLQAERFIPASGFRFIVRRWWRTLPVYFLILPIILLLFEFTTGKPPYLWGEYFIFLQGDHKTATTFFPESWTLCVEEWFYFITALVIILLGATGMDTAKRRYAFLSYTIVVIVGILASRAIYVLSAHPDFPSQVYKITWLRYDAPVYGILFAWCWRFHSGFLTRIRYKLIVPSVLLLAVSVLLLKEKFGTELRSILQLPLCSAGIFLSMPFIICLRTPSAILHRVILFFSHISYPLYLVHLSLVLFNVVQPLLGTPFTVSGAVLAFVFYLLLSTLIATFIHYLFEKPLLRLRDKKLSA